MTITTTSGKVEVPDNLVAPRWQVEMLAEQLAEVTADRDRLARELRQYRQETAA